jgi:hypothetical protein
MAFIVFLFNQVLKLVDLNKTLFIKICLISIESMEIPKQEHPFGFLSRFILVDGDFPENNDGGLFTYADFPTAGPDLLECSIYPALK